MATRTKSTTARKAASPAAGRTAPAKPKAATTRPAAKAAAPASAPAKPPAPLTAAPTPAKDAARADAAPTGRAKRGDLLDAVAARSAMKRAELKVAMDLVLEEMGKLLDAGDEIVVPPLGKLMVKKRISREGGDMLTVKIRRLPPDEPADEGDG